MKSTRQRSYVGKNVPGAINSICEKDAALVKSEASAKKKATLKRAPKAEVKEISKKKSVAVKKAPAVKKPAVDKAKSAAVKIAPGSKKVVVLKKQSAAVEKFLLLSKAPPVKKSVVDKTKSATIKKAPAVKKSVVDKTKSAAIKKAPAVKKSAVDKTKSASVKIAPTTKKLVVLKKQSAALEKLPIVKKPTAPARKKLQALEKPTVVKKQKQKLGKDSVVEIIAAGVDPNSIAGRIKLTARKRTPTSPFTYARASEISVNCLQNVPLLTGVESEKRKVDQMWLETKKSLSLVCYAKLRLAVQDTFEVKSFSKRSKQASAEQYEQFSDQYEIFYKETLGSGQFGTVYAGLHRDSSENVAIKVISLESFEGKANSAVVQTLKSEVAILQSIDHPGIIKVKDPNSRMSEHTAKFLVSQIVAAVEHLHSKGIAHCDLKPENVLLSDFHSDYPQIKLCDFGYARFIEDNQLLRKIVGTPAYLAPEVMSKKGYDRGLFFRTDSLPILRFFHLGVDLWSIGVIIYVTLSGSFPFSDNEDVAAQLDKVDCMFPEDPWRQLSESAVQIIQSLLKIEVSQRLTIKECAEHEWLKDADVYTKLKTLERRSGSGRYLTSEKDDLRYSAKRSRR